MQNRYEQTQLLVSTLNHFGYEQEIDFQIVKNSEHCSYNYEFDNDGNSVFADIIYNFISKYNSYKTKNPILW